MCLEPSQASNQINKKVGKIISFDFKLLKGKQNTDQATNKNITPGGWV